MCDLHEAAENVRRENMDLNAVERPTNIKLVETATMRWFESDQWTVFIDEEGYPLGFEHARFGEEGGTGGLWFDGTHLVDYDGVYNLPKGVIEICEHIGFNMDYAKDDNYEGVEK
jgi:hypothetical protein